MSLSYKNADPLIHGAVKNLTSITKVDKQPHHEEQYYYIFWVSHINKVHISGGLNKTEVIERFKISAKEFDDKLELNEFFCKVCNKENDTAFSNLAKTGDKTCIDCIDV
ncbi:hypothetical protein N9U36_02965 [Candidatus Pelagibacter sp.]|nr:hypothetical protein [Candidatus Pelagibacter sp.]